MSRHTWAAAVCGAALLLGQADTAGARLGGEPPKLLVVPSRRAVIQLAFDIARFQDVALVSYARAPGGADLTLHLWNREARRWEPCGLDDFGARATGLIPSEAFVVGDSAEDIAILAAASRAVKVVRIQSLLAAPILNEVNQSLRFTEREWRWYEREYGVRVTDLNTARRRWGRYGPPDAALAPAPVYVPAPVPVEPKASADLPVPVAPVPAVTVPAAPAAVATPAPVQPVVPAPVVRVEPPKPPAPVQPPAKPVLNPPTVAPPVPQPPAAVRPPAPEKGGDSLNLEAFEMRAEDK